MLENEDESVLSAFSWTLVFRGIKVSSVTVLLMDSDSQQRNPCEVKSWASR